MTLDEILGDIPCLYRDDLCAVIHGDSREVLPYFPKEAFNGIIADAPYGVGYHSNQRITVKSDPLVSPIKNDENLNIVRDIMPNLNRVLANNSHVYLFADPRRIGEMLDITSAYWENKNVLVWHKASGGMGDLEGSYSVAWEAIIFSVKGKRALNGKRIESVIRYDWVGSRQNGVLHPTQKPEGLLELLLDKSLNQGEVVLDCFAGSGSTLMAAKKLGIRSVGIEIDEGFCKSMADRLRQQAMVFKPKHREEQKTLLL